MNNASIQFGMHADNWESMNEQVAPTHWIFSPAKHSTKPLSTFLFEPTSLVSNAPLQNQPLTSNPGTQEIVTYMGMGRGMVYLPTLTHYT